jgi:hypothetical protein
VWVPERNGVVSDEDEWMALMKCAELQKQFGCGTIRQLKITSLTKPDNVPFFWPWLRGRRNVPNEPTINRCVNYD